MYLKKRTAICSFVKTFNKALNLLTKSVLGVVRGLFQKTPPHFPILFPFSEEDADFRIRSLLYSDFFPRSSERIFSTEAWALIELDYVCSIPSKGLRQIAKKYGCNIKTAALSNHQRETQDHAQRTMQI